MLLLVYIPPYKTTYSDTGMFSYVLEVELLDFKENQNQIAPLLIIAGISNHFIPQRATLVK